MGIRVGVIADDFTGATDVANSLVRGGMRTEQVIGVPTSVELASSEADAVVVALKTRTIPPAAAVALSVRAAHSLLEAGAEQIYFKYCSTFDSTPEGNIGPVLDALMTLLGERVAVAVPSSPALGRTLYQGHLFVGATPLHESGMREHPLTPMTDSNIVRWLAPQTNHSVGLITEAVVLDGPSAVRRRLEALRDDHEVGIVVADAVRDEDLLVLGTAFSKLPLVSGGSGLAAGLAASWGFDGTLPPQALPPASGARLVLAGSVSEATRRQVNTFIESGGKSFAIDLERLARGDDVVTDLVDAVSAELGDDPVLIYSTQTPEKVRSFQNVVGRERSGQLIEDALARVAGELVHRGVGALLVAGGETSGAIVQGLGVNALRVGPQIDPGVPWCTSTLRGRLIHIALKSGNLGRPDLFTHAFSALDWNVES